MPAVPNSLTSVAPGAEKRSVIWVVIAALWSAASRSRCAEPAPIRRAGITNTGSRTSASSVICQERRSITASVSTSAITLLTTPESVHVNARWAPMTSLLSRLTSAPVRVRVKNATGIRCTWAEHGPAQVEDDALADPRRLPALGEPSAAVGDGDHGDHIRQGDHGRRRRPA